jgi:acyl-CoA hydrolase
MVAINSAIQVDLTGQVCSDSIGNQFYSGIGGQVDFLRGASRSKGGKPIAIPPPQEMEPFRGLCQHSIRVPGWLRPAV